MKVNVLEARNRLSHLIKAAQAGEDVVIANRGAPVARLVAMDVGAPGANRSGASAEITPPTTQGGVVKWLLEHPLPAYARRSAEEIDADISAERSAWD